jgi:hypothetical protein
LRDDDLYDGRLDDGYVFEVGLRDDGFMTAALVKQKNSSLGSSMQTVSAIHLAAELTRAKTAENMAMCCSWSLPQKSIVC